MSRKILLSVGAVCVSGFGFAAIAGEGSHDGAVPAGYEATGETRSCLPLSRLKDSDPVDDDNLLFEMRGGDMYLNTLDGTCTGLKREGRFSYRTTQRQICKGDVIQVTDQFGIFQGGCALSDFQALQEAADE